MSSRLPDERIQEGIFFQKDRPLALLFSARFDAGQKTSSYGYRPGGLSSLYVGTYVSSRNVIFSLRLSHTMPKTYFAYGSNLWLDQMHRRCPDSSVVGIAILASYRWIISTRGYANVLKSTSHEVYGVLYTISESDEERLDAYEGVLSGSYFKEMLELTDLNGNVITALVYIDPTQSLGTPKKEYIGRMNKGLRDANLPEQWVKENIRPFVSRGVLPLVLLVHSHMFLQVREQ